jgi:diguanylate cyclase (GGDEF)-like protein
MRSPPSATGSAPAAALGDEPVRGGTPARPILWLFAVGAAAATISLVLGPAGAHRTQIAGICGAAWALAVVLCFAPARLPRSAVHVLLACGTLLVEWVTLASGDATSAYPVLYFLIATCAFCFLSRTEAAIQATLIAIAYAAGLVLAPGNQSATGYRWAVFALALVVGGAFIGALRAKQDRLMTDLRRVSRADPVSGLLDQRGFDEAIANELERVRRSGSRFGLILGSIDGFDQIPGRDRHTLLAAVGAVIAGAKRDIDTAARLGGDEFAVLATYTDARGADVLGERICSVAREQAGATLSLGVVSHPRHGASAEILLCAAREARREAAELGGDRSLVAASAADSIAARLEGADVQVVPLG